MRVRFDPRSVASGILGAISGLACLATAQAQTPPPAPVATVDFAYLALATKRVLPLSYLDQPPTDDGIQGARLGLADDETTGRFIHQTYHLTEAILPDAAAVLASFKSLAAAGQKIFVTDLPADLLLQVADLPEAKDATLLDATAQDDRLRADGCRANVLHLLPSRAMLADALMQYLVVKKWRNILLVGGPDAGDKAYADAIRHAAAKFQISYRPGQALDLRSRRPPHRYRPLRDRGRGRALHPGRQLRRAGRGRRGRQFRRRAVLSHDRSPAGRRHAGAGAQRLGAAVRAMGRHAAAEPLPEAGRALDDRPGLWRLDGGARGRRGGGPWQQHGPPGDRGLPAQPGFRVWPAFKGARLSFRSWDGQLRQPVLLADARSLVSVSPQPGFLHQFSELDTLGVDQPEASCHMK